MWPAIQLARFGDELSVHVHHEDGQGIRIADQLADYCLNAAVIFFVEQELLTVHSQNSW